MKNKDLIPILLIIGMIIVLAVGFVAGILIQKQTTVPQLEKALKLIDLAESDIIQSITAGGEVTKISDRTITLTIGEESLAVPIAEDAEIISFIPPPIEGEPAQRKEINLTDIEVGSFLTVNLKILPDGGFEGTTVFVFPIIYEEIYEK